MLLKLYGFRVCPYYNRILIALNYRKIPFQLEYIDLANKPDWFLKISPLGKVPVLVIDNKYTLFESNIILQFIDEVFAPSTLSTNPIERSVEKAYMEYASNLFMAFYDTLMAVNPEILKANITELEKKFEHLETILADTGYFKGSQVSVIDCAYAPLLHRISILPTLLTSMNFAKLPKFKKWLDNVTTLSVIKEISTKEFLTDLKNFLAKGNALLANDLKL